MEVYTSHRDRADIQARFPPTAAAVRQWQQQYVLLHENLHQEAGIMATTAEYRDT